MESKATTEETKADSLASDVEKMNLNETKDTKESAKVSAYEAENMTWDDLGIKKEIKEGLLDMDFIKPSKVQSTTFPLVMKEEGGKRKHLIAQAKNGAGKTASFGLAAVSLVDESNPSPQVIIFAHYRELVSQTTEVLRKIAAKTKVTINAWLSEDKTPKEAQIIVMTPGNFENMVLKRKKINLGTLKMMVLDEADFMLSAEKSNVNRKIFTTTFQKITKEFPEIQMLFFSATYTADNYKFIEGYFKDCNKIELKTEELSLDNVKQMYFECSSNKEKIDFIEKYLKSSLMNERVIIFINKRDDAVKIQQLLNSKGYRVFILMGGDMDKQNRDETIKRFNAGQIHILITTNLLSRGYDEKLVKLVINFDLPEKYDEKVKSVDLETYLHRIGRTGRFGSKGIGLSLVFHEQLKDVGLIEDNFKCKIQKIESFESLFEEYKKEIFESKE